VDFAVVLVAAGVLLDDVFLAAACGDALPPRRVRAALQEAQTNALETRIDADLAWDAAGSAQRS
jgi:hypothetical protein